jgi:hypothetical protein
MAYWNIPLVVNGKIVDLSHVEPFTFTIVPTDFIYPRKHPRQISSSLFQRSYDSAHITISSISAAW